MCYYEQTHYSCKDWKWGNMKQRCNQQHRIGETCGRKLVHPEYLTESPDVCRFCKDIAIKQRKRLKELDNIARWKKEGSTFQASIDKALAEVEHLAEAIKDINSRRPSVVAGLNTSRQSTSAPGRHGKLEDQVEFDHSTYLFQALPQPDVVAPASQQELDIVNRVNRHAFGGSGGMIERHQPVDRADFEQASTAIARPPRLPLVQPLRGTTPATKTDTVMTVVIVIGEVCGFTRRKPFHIGRHIRVLPNGQSALTAACSRLNACRAIIAITAPVRRAGRNQVSPQPMTTYVMV